MSKWIETWNGGYEIPDYTNSEELSKDLSTELSNAGLQQPERIGKEDYDSLSSRLGRYLRMKIDDISKIPELLKTAVQGPDPYTESGASSYIEGHYKQDQLEAVNNLVGSLGLTTSVASTGAVGAGSLGTFMGKRGYQRYYGLTDEQMAAHTAKLDTLYAQKKQEFSDFLHSGTPEADEYKLKFLRLKQLLNKDTTVNSSSIGLTSFERQAIFKLKQELYSESPDFKFWLETGAHKGADKQYRYGEIPDNPELTPELHFNEGWNVKTLKTQYGSAQTPVKTLSFDQLMVNNEWKQQILSAYPEFKDYKFTIAQDSTGDVSKQLGIQGNFDPEKKHMLIITDTDKLTGANLMKTAGVILHEMGHGVQGIENWSRGGNLKSKGEAQKQFWEESLSLQKEQEYTDSSALQAAISNSRQKTYDDFLKLSGITSDQFYHKLYGEMEARLIDKRYQDSIKYPDLDPYSTYPRMHEDDFNPIITDKVY